MGEGTKKRNLLSGGWILIAGFMLLGGSDETPAFTLISNSGKVALWPSGGLTYNFHSSVPSGNRAAFRNAFSTWSQVPGVALLASEGADVSSEGDGDDRVNTIVWTTSGWRQLSFRPPQNALAVTLLSFDPSSGAITDADVFFNSESFSWGDVAESGNSSLIDIQNIATHEIGHVLGLDHASEDFFEPDIELYDATMYYASGAGEVIRRDLGGDDENGIRALYNSSTPSTPSLSAVTEVSRSGGDVQFQVTGDNFSELTSFVLSPRGSSSDRVARYRTISSPTSALITLDLESVNGAVDLIAYNHPSSMSSFSMSVTGTSISATNTGGGGGCSLQQSRRSSMSWVTFYFVFLASISLFLARRRYQNKVRTEPVEEEF